MLGHMLAQDKNYICQTLVEICTVAIYFGLDISEDLLNIKSAWKMSDVRPLFHAL